MITFSGTITKYFRNEIFLRASTNILGHPNESRAQVLRGLNYRVSNFMPKTQLLRLLRFAVDSDDRQHDPRSPPLR